jgi:hypothetical protein
MVNHDFDGVKYVRTLRCWRVEIIILMIHAGCAKIQRVEVEDKEKRNLEKGIVMKAVNDH